MQHTESAFFLCCKLVDTKINSLGRNQIQSNSLHRARIKSRNTLNAARKLVERAKSMKVSLDDYLTLAIEAADLVSNNGLSINTLAGTKVHQQLTKGSSYFSRSRAQNRTSMQGIVTKLDAGRQKSVITSIRIVMESLHQHNNSDIVPLLIALRTVLDPALLYSSEEIRNMVDHDALILLGISRPTIRARYDQMLHDRKIVRSPEWRWWCSHVSMNERHAMIVEE